LPQVASDPVVSRPLRPEQLSGRSGAPAGEASGAFEGLLDTPAAQRSRPDTPNAPPAKNGQSADPGEPVAKAAETVAQATPIPPVDFAAIAEALTVQPQADAEPVEQMTDTAPATPDQSKASDDAAVVLAPDATVAPPPATAIAIALPAMPATSAAAAVNADIAGLASVELQASAPAIPAAAEPPTSPSLSAETGAHAAANAHAAAAAAATAALVEKTAPPDDALKAAGLPETSDKKDATAVHADSKSESGKAKADRPGTARAPDAQPHQNATRSATAATPEPQPNAVQHQPRPETAERAPPTTHAGAADARPELPVTAAPQAQIHAGGPHPFGLAIHAATPFASVSPLTALRIDASADNAVPVAGLAVEIVSRAQDGLRRFDIRLDPPELGRIDVRLDVDTAGKVTSRLTVERAETLDLLRRDAPQLERALQHAGLNTEGGLEFSLRDQNFANREQAPRNPAAAQLLVPEDEAAAAEAARRGYGRMIGLGGGVDIRV